MHSLLVLVCILLSCWSVAADLRLEILDSNFANQAGARCLDGTPGSVHFEKGAETKKWVIYMQGGGSCDREAGCLDRANRSLGSSAKQPLTIPAENIFSTDPVANPGFWNWTHVHLDYCSGDRWAGTRVNASAESWGLYFAGHIIFQTLIEHLIIKYNLDDATEILFQGGSAGALGVMSNADYLNKRLPVPRISLAMNAGWGVDYRPPWSGPGVDREIDVILNLYQGHLNEACLAANPTNKSRCIFPREVYAYIPNRLFVLNSLIDEVQLSTLGFKDSDIKSPGGADYLVSLGYYTRDAILENFKRDPRVDGLFVTTCPDHIIAIEIRGSLPLIAEAEWYYRPKSSSKSAITYDNCAIESVVSLLKANTSLFTDCATLMRICQKNTNESTPNAFEAAFLSAAPLPGDEEPTANEPTNDDGNTGPESNNTKSAGNEISIELVTLAVFAVSLLIL